jgi:hypothetical protein
MGAKATLLRNRVMPQITVKVGDAEITVVANSRREAVSLFFELTTRIRPFDDHIRDSAKDIADFLKEKRQD